MHLRSVITLFILLSFLHHSSVSSCSYLSTASTSHTFQPYQTASQAYAYLTHFSPAFLLSAGHRRPLRRCSPFLLACLLLSGDIELNPGPANFTVRTLNIRSILHLLHSAAFSDLIVSHHPDLFCLNETWIKNSTTCTELTDCTPPNYTFLSTPRTSSKGNTSAVVGGGTGFLIREPFTQLSTSMPQFSSFEHSSVTLKLPQS